MIPLVAPIAFLLAAAPAPAPVTPGVDPQAVRVMASFHLTANPTPPDPRARVQANIGPYDRPVIVYVTAYGRTVHTAPDPAAMELLLIEIPANLADAVRVRDRDHVERGPDEVLEGSASRVFVLRPGEARRMEAVTVPHRNSTPSAWEFRLTSVYMDVVVVAADLSRPPPLPVLLPGGGVRER